ncbi:MAG TPA: hypothetical protein VGO55_09380 [Allosphingosinicella sp.]|jgi:hypothetical protein|nr:hypothetical protein [Allosphingosinicella sp.]
MRAFLPAFICALLLAAAPGARANGISSPGSDRLRALSPLNQRIALWRAIRASGQTCSRVIALAYQQDYHHLAMWVARCEGGRRWAVFIAPNDDVQVRNCAEHAQLGLPACRPVR